MICRYATALHAALITADWASAAVLFVAVSIFRFGAADWVVTWVAGRHGVVCRGRRVRIGLGRCAVAPRPVPAARALVAPNRDHRRSVGPACSSAVVAFGPCSCSSCPDVSRLFLLTLFVAQIVADHRLPVRDPLAPPGAARPRLQHALHARRRHEPEARGSPTSSSATASSGCGSIGSPRGRPGDRALDAAIGRRPARSLGGHARRHRARSSTTASSTRSRSAWPTSDLALRRADHPAVRGRRQDRPHPARRATR